MSLTKGQLPLCFQRFFSVPAASPKESAQNNQYAKDAYLGVANSAPPHLQIIKWTKDLFLENIKNSHISIIIIIKKNHFKNKGSRHLSKIQFSCSVVSNSLRPHGLQHARLPCPSPTPRDYSNSCPSSQ